MPSRTRRKQRVRKFGRLVASGLPSCIKFSLFLALDLTASVVKLWRLVGRRKRQWRAGALALTVHQMKSPSWQCSSHWCCFTVYVIRRELAGNSACYSISLVAQQTRRVSCVFVHQGLKVNVRTSSTYCNRCSKCRISCRATLPFPDL